MSQAWDVQQQAIRDWVARATGVVAYWGEQASARPQSPAVEMRCYTDDAIGLPWVDHDQNTLTFADKTVAAVSPGSDTLTITAHGLNNGDGPVQMSGTALPGGLAVSTDYWVIFVDANTIKLASAFASTGGAYINGAPSGNPVTPIDITSAGSGAIALTATADTVPAGAEIIHTQRSIDRLILLLQCHADERVGLATAIAILKRVAAKAKLPGQMAILEAAGLAFTDAERVRSIHGTQNAVQYEPRATVEIYLSAVSEETETGTVISRVTGTNQVTNKPFSAP